jgi:hypothetical protein
MCAGTMPRNKRSKVFLYNILLRALILAVAVAASLAAYFALSAYVIPQSYSSSEPPRPEPIVTGVSLSASEVALGQTFTISTMVTNRGDQSDVQVVSVGFPNITSTDGITVLKHNFVQSPFFVQAGQEVGTGYTGFERTVKAEYPSVEAATWSWKTGSTYSIDVQVKPDVEGRFVIFVKSIALPHSWEQAHYPHEGLMDYQQEFVQAYSVQVTTKP